MDIGYFKICVTTVLAVIGWLIAHHFTAQRTLAVKRRDVTLEHLISAYRILTNEISQRTLDADRSKKLECLLSDIQLFGSKDQVNSAREMIDQVVAKKSFDLDPIINSLRDDLRKQLQLEEVSGNVKWLRYENIDAKPSTDS